MPIRDKSNVNGDMSGQIIIRLEELSEIVNSFSGGMIFRGEYQTYQDMIDAIDNPQIGYTAFITEDETKDGARTQYVYNGEDWLFAGSVVHVNDATQLTKGIVRLNGSLSGTADNPKLSNTGVASGNYNLGGNIVTVNDEGRIINIVVSTKEEWEYKSLANTRSEDQTVFTVPQYDLLYSEILFFWNGNLLVHNRDYEKTDETIITTKFNIRPCDDVVIKNIKYVGALPVSAIINDNLPSNVTTYSSQKSDSLYYRNDRDILPTEDGLFDLGDTSYKFDNIYLQNAPTVLSSIKYKENVKTCNLGLEFINQLQPVTYNYIGHKRPHFGLIAEDVEQIINKMGIDFGGFIHDKKSGIKALRYEEFISPLIMSVQELHKQIESQNNEIQYLKLPLYKKIWLKIKKIFGVGK